MIVVLNSFFKNYTSKHAQWTFGHHSPPTLNDSKQLVTFLKL